MRKKVFEKIQEGKGEYQLICFPYLGGYASAFCNLADVIDQDFEIWAINPPGHGGMVEKCEEDINSLVKLYYEELKTIIKPNCIFFGHSMGGIISYFLIQRIIHLNEYKILPKALVLSASGTPDEFAEKTFSALSDEALIEKLIAYGGMPDEVLREESLLTYLLPIFRADYRVLESAADCECTPLDIPAYLLWGEQDLAEPFEVVLQWSDYFVNNLNMISIRNGKHMFIHDEVATVAKHLETVMKEYCLEGAQ